MGSEYLVKEEDFSESTKILREVVQYLMGKVKQEINEKRAEMSNYISNDDTQDYPFCRLILVIETFQH